MTTVNSLDIFVCTNFIHLEFYIQVYMTTVNSLDIFVCTNFIHLEFYIQVYMTTVNSLGIFVCTNFIHLEVYIQVYMTTVNSLDILVCWVCVAQSLVFFVVLSRNLFVLLSCLCLYFFDLCLLITPLVSSNLSELQSMKGSG